MTDYIWVVELSVKPGMQEGFKDLMQDMVAVIEQNEPGTLNYQLFFNAEEGIANIFEQYEDGMAFKSHLENFNRQFAVRFGEVVEVTRFTALGNPNSEIREILAGFGAIVLEPLIGFAR